MSTPSANINIIDGGLGVVKQVGENYICIGTATSGTIAHEYSFTNSNGVESTLGQGPLKELVADVLAIAGGPVYAMRASGSVAATNDSTATAGGSGPLVSLSGSAYDTYAGIVKIVNGGLPTVASFKYSLDGGRSYSQTFTVPAAKQFTSILKKQTGLELGFVDSSYVAGEEYTFSSTAPHFNSSDLAEVMAVASGSQTQYDLYGFAGVPASASDGSTLCAALDTHMSNLESMHRYARAVIDMGSDDTVANAISELGNWDSKRISPVYGKANMASSAPVTGGGSLKRSGVNPYFARLCSIAAPTSAGRRLDGSLAGVIASTLSHDSRLDSRIHDLGAATLTTVNGRSGAYVTAANIHAPVGSDFDLMELARVFDMATSQVFTSGSDFINSSVRTIKGGYIDKRDAKKIELHISRALAIALTSPVNAEGFAGFLSTGATPNGRGFSVSVDTTNNVASSRTVLVTVTLYPLATVETLTATVGFSI